MTLLNYHSLMKLLGKLNALQNQLPLLSLLNLVISLRFKILVTFLNNFLFYIWSHWLSFRYTPSFVWHDSFPFSSHTTSWSRPSLSHSWTTETSHWVFSPARCVPSIYTYSVFTSQPSLPVWSLYITQLLYSLFL